MSDTNPYKARSATVRGRARAQLSAIRKERLARKGLATHGEPAASHWPASTHHDPEPVTDHPPAAERILRPGGDARPEPEPAPCAPAETETGHSEHAPAPSRDADDPEPDQPPAEAPGPDPTEAFETPSLLPTDPPATDGPGEAASPPCEPAASGGSGDDTPNPCGPQVPERMQDAQHATLHRTMDEGATPGAFAPDSDLFEIPGAGSGLVWMLQSAGIATLDDLARADARDLGMRLGMVARLLDLDGLVDFARAARR